MTDEEKLAIALDILSARIKENWKSGIDIDPGYDLLGWLLSINNRVAKALKEISSRNMNQAHGELWAVALIALEAIIDTTEFKVDGASTADEVARKIIDAFSLGEIS